MNKKFFSVIFILLFVLLLSGCSALPKIASLSISFDPNPVPYDSTDGKWHFTITINESNGVGVTVSSIRFDGYNQNEELYDTDYHYYDDFIVGFETDYVPAFSSIQAGFIHTGSITKYNIITISGIDDNDNPVEASARVDYLPQ
jgi:hypothetical protein